MASRRVQRVLLLSNGFGGATMAAYCWLRDRGIQTAFQPATDGGDGRGHRRYGPDLIFAPTLTAKVPEELFGRVAINHPGRMGDRGASSIDWGRCRREPFGGTTLLLAADGWDTGDIVHTTTFRYPDGPATKSWIYAYQNRAAMMTGLEHLVGEHGRRGRSTTSTPTCSGRGTTCCGRTTAPSTGRCPPRRSCGGRPRGTARPVSRAVLPGRAVRIFDVHPAGPTRGDAGGWSAGCSTAPSGWRPGRPRRRAAGERVDRLRQGDRVQATGRLVAARRGRHLPARQGDPASYRPVDHAAARAGRRGDRGGVQRRLVDPVLPRRRGDRRRRGPPAGDRRGRAARRRCGAVRQRDQPEPHLRRAATASPPRRGATSGPSTTWRRRCSRPAATASR